MRKLLREPLLHFVFLGAIIFVIYHFVAGGSASRLDEIVVTSGRIDSMVSAFRLKWQRNPNDAEMDGLIREYVRDEMAAREATTLGLDQDDPVIRNRLRLKLEAVSKELLADTEPSDQQLNEWLQAHPDQFRTEDRVTFQQVYLNPQKHGAKLANDAAELLLRLGNSAGRADATALGDSAMLDPRFEDVTREEIKKQFGDGFASEISAGDTGHWRGPVMSGYGAHLVFVERIKSGRLPALNEIRNIVRREWINARSLEASDRFYEALQKRYEVKIEKPAPISEKHALAEANK